MSCDETFCFKLDKGLYLENPDFGKELNTDNRNDEEAKTIPFPSDYTLAIFSSTAYQNYYYGLADNWKLLTTATNTDINNGYFGIALWNSRLCQVIVAHRGTDISTFGALLSDAQLGLSNTFHTRQSQSAATFVYIVSEEIKKKNSNSTFKIQLSITGHSLGAWLAQVTTFTVKYFKEKHNKFVEDENYLQNIHAHTVVFESPGCKEALSKLAEKFVPRYVHRKFANFNSLDMTVYLSELNPINSVHHHVGTIYMVKSQTHSIRDIVTLFNYETHTIERNIVLDFKSGMRASGKLLLKYLLPSSWMKQKVKLEPDDNTKCSLNVFTEEELDFVYDWNYIVERYSVNAKKYKKEQIIPEFEVDDEYNFIKSDDFHNLNKAIASIKYLRPTKSTIFNWLESDVHDQVHLEIFKLEAKHFQESILKFHRYYFKDRYGLKEHLLSNTQDLLHIHVDKNSMLEYELETSIVNNILTYYKRNEPTLFDSYFSSEDSFIIIDWSILYKKRNFLLKILGKTKDKVNLLIIEYFEVFGKHQSEILQSLLTSGAKVILISTEQLSVLKGENIKRVSGFGSDIKFQDLLEESQLEFWKQPTLSLYDKTLNLNNIIEEENLQDKEVYEYLNKTVLTLLEFMLTDETGLVVMDCPYHNLLQNVVFRDLYQEINIKQFLSQKYNDQFLFYIEAEEHDLLRNIDKANVKVQAKVMIEEECIQNFDKIIYFLKIIEGKLYLIKIFNKNFYIPRNIIHNHTVKPEIFYPSNGDPDFYYFCGDDSKYKCMYAPLDKRRKNQYNFVHTTEKGKYKLRHLEEQESGHLFKITADRIEWIYSCGNMKLLRKYMKSNKDSFDEIDLINHQQIVILSGEPGMGKSSTVGRLFLKYKQKDWVFAVPLRNSKYNDIDNNINFDLIAKFILRTCKASNVDCLQYLLSYCLKNKTKLNIYLMFDGFDEIPTYEERDKFVELINYLKNNSSVKILITTRKYACKALENGLSIFSSHYEVIDDNDDSNTKTLEFFNTFQYSQWQLFKPDIDINEIKLFNEKSRLLENAKYIFGETITSFIGIPMQMRMLAEVITLPEPFQVLEITLADILSLYQKYTEIYYNTYFRRSGIPSNPAINDWLKESIFTKLCKLATIKLFNLNTNYIKENDINELNKVGLIQSDHEYSNINFEFLHDSVRDLFIAQLLKMWLECQFIAIHPEWDLEKFIVSDFLTDGKYKEVRFFVNYYLKHEISEKRLNVCRDQIFELLEENQDVLVNAESQETVFHVCVNENLCYLLKHFVFKIIDCMSKKELLSKRNIELKTSLFLAVRKLEDVNSNDAENVLLIFLEELNRWSNPDEIKAVLLSSLYIYELEEKDIQTLKEYSGKFPDIIKMINIIEENYKYTTLLLNACHQNDIKEVNNILDKFKNDVISRRYLLLSTNPRKETCLHLTTNKDITEQLLRLSCDKNLQDSHGMTPLNRAIKNKQTDIALKLINKGARNIPDSFGFTAFLHAAKQGDLQVLKQLNSKDLANVSIDERNIFGVSALMIAAKYGNELVANYLLSKGADPNAIDKHGMTPVHYAVTGNCTKLINLFRQKGADINIMNFAGMTPLMFSIMKNRKDMIICLLDNGADVNVSSTRHYYPLKKLIELKEHGMIKKILKEEHIKTKGGGIIVRLAARTDILTSEEMDYVNSVMVL